VKRLGLRARIAGLVGAGVLVAIIGYVAVVAPERARIGSLSSQISAAQTAFVSAQAARATARHASAVELYGLQRAMPSGDDMPGIVLALDRLSRSTGVTFDSVRPAPRVALGDGSSAVPLTVVIDGKFAAIESFLTRLRKQVTLRKQGPAAAGRLFAVDQVALATSTGAVGKLTATLSVNAFDYGSPPSASATAGTEAATATTTTDGATKTPAPGQAVAAGSTGGAAG
jgi:Tfp pilus assembly protein PilO